MVSAYCLTKHLEELTGVLDAQCGNLRFHLEIILMASFTILEALNTSRN